MPSVSTSSPPVLLSRLTAETSGLRLGAGGIMLPHHPPLVVAEQFGMLGALAPGRIDLGLGLARGTDHATAAALYRGASDAADFPWQVLELLHFLGDDFTAEPPTPTAYTPCRGPPGPAQRRHPAHRPPAGVAPRLLRLLGAARRPAGPGLVRDRSGHADGMVMADVGPVGSARAFRAGAIPTVVEIRIPVVVAIQAPEPAARAARSACFFCANSVCRMTSSKRRVSPCLASSGTTRSSRRSLWDRVRALA